MYLTADILEEISLNIYVQFDTELEAELLQHEFGGSLDAATVICDSLEIERRGNRREIVDIINKHKEVQNA